MGQFLLQKAGGGSYLQDGDFLQGTGDVITGTLAVTLDDATSAAVGVVWRIGSLAETLADHTVVASGTVDEGITGTLAQTLDDFEAQGFGTFTPKVVVTGTAASTLDDATVVAVGIVWVIGTVAVTLADHTATTTGHKYGPLRPAGITKAGPDQGHTHVSEPATISSSEVSDVDGPTRPGGDQDQSRVGV